MATEAGHRPSRESATPYGVRADNAMAKLLLRRAPATFPGGERNARKMMNTQGSKAVDYIQRSGNGLIHTFYGFIARVCVLRGVDELGQPTTTNKLSQAQQQQKKQKKKKQQKQQKKRRTHIKEVGGAVEVDERLGFRVSGLGFKV